MKLYEKYDPATYSTRDLFRKVCETGDLRYVWAHENAVYWKVDESDFLALCETHCPICESQLNYGLGKNNPGNNKPKQETPSTHHIIPQSYNGPNTIENFKIICMACNSLLSNFTHKDASRFKACADFLQSNQLLYENNIKS